MVTALQIRKRLNETPFRPFRIHLSDGSSHDVPNHDAAFVSRQGVEVGIDQDEHSIPGRVVFCAMLHISRIEDLSAQAA